MTTQIQNPNEPQYWVEVKRRAAIRKGLKIVRDGMKSMRASSVYEQYVLDTLHLVKTAAQSAALNGDADNYLAFKVACAKELQLPELIELGEGEIAVLSSEAVMDALTALQGEGDEL